MALPCTRVNDTLARRSADSFSTDWLRGVATLPCRAHTYAMTTGTGASRERANAAGTGPEAQGDVPADTFAARLVLVRHHAGRLSIEQAARLTGLNSGNWARWEDGARPRDRIEVSQAISEALNIDLDWLMFGGALIPARGRPTKRRTVDTTWNHPRPGGAGQVTNRPPRGGSKVRVDRVRPISVPPPGRRANYIGTNRQTEARSVA
jgi:hypothetical protein